jgi:hypothetical protein
VSGRSRTVQTRLTQTDLPMDAAAEGDVCCSVCSKQLILHQPDFDRPDRLLGVCPKCRAWFVVDRQGGTLLCLPEPGVRGRKR